MLLGLLIPKRILNGIKSRARSGDPLSVGLIVLWMLYKYSKKRSAKTGYATKLLPGETVTITNLAKGSKKSR
jgi:hypothetical protein